MFKQLAPYAVIVLLMAALWHVVADKRLVQTEGFVNVPEPRTIVNVRRVAIPAKQIVVMEKATAARKLNLPQSLKSAPETQVLAAGHLAPHEGEATVTAIINTATGETTLISRREPPPFIGFPGKHELGLRYGAGTQGNAMSLFYRYEFLRIGNVHSTLYAEAVDSSMGDPELKAQIELSYRW